MAKRARGKSADASVHEQDTGPRTIVLFSDGTGNSSAKLQKTNVWRLYEALDLGYPAIHRGNDQIAHSDNVQVAYYDDGVGTSAFKLLAILGGVFGFGLARNICDIYKFLCRNYREEKGDPIFAFGFSRGAFTIRLLVGMIAAQGIVKYENERNLDFDARDVWSEHRRRTHTNNCISDFIVSGLRALKRTAIRAKRWFLQQRRYAAGLAEIRKEHGVGQPPWFGREWYNHWFLSEEVRDRLKPPEMGPQIAFVGVWDTVAAYGGPIVEITRGIDEWIWPLTMSNYKLSQKVERARHALAIDDKRDAFQPLLWDETDETDTEQKQPRLQQVWFSGMHADVGGGYADESLSFVSLYWMIEHAEKAGLRLLEEHRRKIEQFRNVYGPIHDSRGGGGAFYRYQPRYINAWIGYGKDKLAPKATQIFRDPTIDRKRYALRGLLNDPVRLHKSVVERLQASTDGYGPNNLPESYLLDEGIGGATPPPVDNRVSRQNLLELGARIKLRRFWFFVGLAITFLTLAKPWWDFFMPEWLMARITGRTDARTDAQPIEGLVSALLPGFADRWLTSFAADPFIFVVLVLALLATIGLGAGHEKAMVDQSRWMWALRLQKQGNLIRVRPGRNPVSWFMHKAAAFVAKTDWLQWSLAKLKWRIMPFFTGLALFWLLLMLGFASLAQLHLAFIEDDNPHCVPGTDAAEPDGKASIKLQVANPCQDTGIDVAEKKVYYVQLVTKGWEDGGKTASPVGWDTGRAFEWRSMLSKPFRRVVAAPLFEPIFATRDLRAQKAGDPDSGVYIFRPRFRKIGSEPGRREIWEAEFELPKGKGGRLFFFVNDAYFPIDPSGVIFDLEARYRNNKAEIAEMEFWRNGKPSPEQH